MNNVANALAVNQLSFRLIEHIALMQRNQALNHLAHNTDAIMKFAVLIPLTGALHLMVYEGR